MSEQEPSGWAIGWTLFAGIMMVMMGGWWVLSGLIALLNSDFYVVTRNWIFQFDISTWAWIHLILGVIILVAGLFLFTGATWARVIGVILAVLAALAAFAWLPYYPVWGILFIAISIGVIWALTAHGRDIKMAQ
jgi:hypothetical protein